MLLFTIFGFHAGYITGLGLILAVMALFGKYKAESSGQKGSYWTKSNLRKKDYNAMIRYQQSVRNRASTRYARLDLRRV